MRLDACVFIVALQRAASKCQVKHVQSLNRLVVWMKNNPQRLTYRPLKGKLRLLTFSDSAFKKEEETGHALKGTLVLLVEAASDGVTTEVGCHVLDFSSKRVRHVTRSTFSAELFALCDSIDHSLLLAQMIHEIYIAPDTVGGARRRRESVPGHAPVRCNVQ